MKVESLAEQLFFTTGYVQGTMSDGRTSVGTGFVYAVETTAGPVRFLVTNKHVLAGMQSVVVRFIRADESGGAMLGKATQVTISEFEDSFVGHPDPKIDVAIMPLGAVLDDMETRGAPAFTRSVTPELCLTRESVEELDALEDVRFIGYPNGLFDTDNFLPIARRGSTATPIAVDYKGEPAFLIDAAVFQGSSGSPVCLADLGIFHSKSGDAMLGNRFVCLGVLAAVHVKQETGELVLASSMPTSSRVAPTFDLPLALGIVYKAWCFTELAEKYILDHGLRLAPPSTPEKLLDPGAGATAAEEELEQHG